MHRTRLGLQIPNFTYPGVQPAQLFGRVVDQAVAAEQSGFDTVFVMDHFYQLPMMGAPEQEMFEAYTLLGALAARTSSVRLGTLVTGVTYRHPSHLAKAVTALDVISGGRALLGIGAAWFDLEHHSLGFDFPPLRERYERLTDALEICRGMFTQPQTTYAGTHFSVDGAFNQPAPINGEIPIMIGGQGERKTFGLAARYANELNTIAAFSDIPRKLEALDERLAEVGRDRSDITVTPLGTLVLGETHDAARAKLARLLAAGGLDLDAVLADPAMSEMVTQRMLWGDPDEVTEQVRALLDTGLDGLVVNMIADPGDAEAVAFAGEVLGKALAR